MPSREGPGEPVDATMRVALAVAGGHLEIASQPLPQPGPGEALVQVRACGICGSDLHARRAGSWSEGHVPGHEIAGRVASLGSGTAAGAGGAALSAGREVVIEPLVGCGVCQWCRSGRDSICPSLSILGVHRAGGFAEYVLAPAERLYPIDPGIAPAVATLVEPLAVALHGLDRAGFEAEERLLVVGAGPIGLLTLVAAQSRGAGEVAVSAKYPAQAEQARRLGASAVLDATRPLDARGLRARFDVVVETVGGASQSLVEAAYHLVPGGRIAVLGLFDPDPPLDPETLLEKEATLLWSNCYHRPRGERSDFARAVSLVEEKAGDLGTLVRTLGALDRIEEGLERAARRDEGFSKLAILPSQGGS